MIYLFAPETLEIIVEIDCEVELSYRQTVRWTTHPVETGVITADYGIVQPRTFAVRGLVTAWPLRGTDRGAARQQTVLSRLLNLAKSRDPVTLISGSDAVDCVLSQVEGRYTDESDMLTISLQLQEITVVRPDYTDMPAKRFGEKVRKQAAPKPAFANVRSAGSAADPVPRTIGAQAKTARAQAAGQSWAAKMADVLRK